MSDTEGMNVTEAAAFLGMSRTTIYGFLRAGTIPHRMVGTDPRFSKTALAIWMGGEPLQGILANIVAIARTTAPTSPTPTPTRLKPKHVGGRGRTANKPGAREPFVEIHR